MDRRIPMIAGIAVAVLFASALLMVPALPGIDKPGYDIVSHVNEHSGAMRMQALVVTFGSLALVVVLGFARVFGAPWQARALAIAVALVDNLDLPWDTFRRRLMDEIATDPQRACYASWSAHGNPWSSPWICPRPPRSTLPRRSSGRPGKSSTVGRHE